MMIQSLFHRVELVDLEVLESKKRREYGPDN